MNKIYYSFVAAALLLLSSGCNELRGIRGNRNITTDNRAVEAFTKLEASGAYDIEWTAGAPAIAITTDENLLPLIETEVDDGTLSISNRKRISPTKGIKVKVSSPNLAGAELTGATKFIGKAVNGSSFELTTTGASKVTLDGAVDSLDAELTGASKLRAAAFQTRKADLNLTGASDAEVAVSGELSVSISGAGKVTYLGEPKILRQDIAGAGKIRKKD